MNPLKIGACLAPFEIHKHRDWLFEANRDIELQGFSTHKDLEVRPVITVRYLKALEAAKRVGARQMVLVSIKCFSNIKIDFS